MHREVFPQTTRLGGSCVWCLFWFMECQTRLPPKECWCFTLMSQDLLFQLWHMHQMATRTRFFFTGVYRRIISVCFAIKGRRRTRLRDRIFCSSLATLWETCEMASLLIPVSHINGGLPIISIFCRSARYTPVSHAPDSTTLILTLLPSIQYPWLFSKRLCLFGVSGRARGPLMAPR